MNSYNSYRNGKNVGADYSRSFTKKAIRLIYLFLAGTISITTACTEQETEIKTSETIKKEIFGTLEDGREAHIFTLTNSRNTEVKITNYGGTITSIRTPDAEGNVENIVLGFDNLEDYQKDHPYFGSTIGRFGNRIAGGSFELNGTEFSLPVNDGQHHLHGGPEGFHRILFDAEVIEGGKLKLTHRSEDGHMGYPGNLDVEVTFALTDENELVIDYLANTDKETPVNLTNHSYFNLTGDASNSILDHQLKINAEHYTPVNESLIPTGEIAPVENTPFDYTKYKAIREDFDEVEGGYDHNFVVSKEPSDTLQLVASVLSPENGRELRVYSMEPGVQFYSGNFLDGSLEGPDGTAFEQHAAFCLETQHFPNSPNESEFPSTILKPDEEYRTTTVYQFIAEK